MQHAGGELAHHDGALVGLLQGGHGGAAADVPAVDEEVLHGAVGPAGGGRADKALHLYMAQLVVDGNEGGGELPAVDGVNGGGELAVPRGVELLLAVPEEPEGNLRVGQGQLIQNARHGVALGGVLFEELHAGGGVVEQIPHQNGGALGAAGVLQGGLLGAAAGVAHPCHRAGGAGEQLHVGHGGDGGQRLPAEAQGGDGVQVVLPHHLAGGVAQKGGGHVLGGDATAVVRHPHKGDAPPADFHRDDGGAGVYGVLHQLFDNGRWPIHHLARGNELRHLLI